MVLLVVMLIGAYQGFKKGLLLEIVALVSFVLAIVGGIYLLDWAIGLIAGYIEGMDHLLPFLAFILLFVGIVLLVNLVGKIVKKALDLTPLSLIDKVAGLCLGVLKLAFFMSLLIWGAAALSFSLEESLTAGSLLYPIVEPMAPFTFELLMGVFPQGRVILEALPAYFS